MKIRNLIFILMIILASNSAAFDVSMVPDEYTERMQDAFRRAGENRTALEVALSDVPEDRREAMSFLIVNLPNVDLAAVSSEFLLETIEYAYRIRETFHWAKQVPEDIFLHHVVSPRTSQEPLQRWRPFFWKNLYPRIKDLASMEDVALEVNRWCGENVDFKQTQRRDQAPLETLKSGYGRCEEMVIFYNSALKSVGIPARKAWTPYWATTDNNHAWTEVWADGNWYYAGACEPRDELNSAWFDERVKDAAFVYSATYGIPDYTSKIYKTGERWAIINSTENYLTPGTIQVTVLNHEQPVSEADVAVSVFNFGALRAIGTKESDENGSVEFEIGSGTYVVSAGDSVNGYWKTVEVTPGEITKAELDISKENPEQEEFWLRYREEDLQK